MTRKRVLIIGSTGMLGRAVFNNLRATDLSVLETSRTSGLLFDAETDSAEALLEAAGLRKGDFVVNCAGLTKSHIDDSKMETIERAVRLNILFPIRLARAADRIGIRVIQVATDCVFSGNQGAYVESDFHDALDVYGKTKSLGEAVGDNIMHLRCSLIGPEEPGRETLLFDWVRSLGESAEIDGFTNHLWNGLTSDAFARIVRGILLNDSFTSGLRHLVPVDVISKYSLIGGILSRLGRADVIVRPTETERKIDRTLGTLHPTGNQRLFELAGYQSIPTIAEMLDDLQRTLPKSR